MSKQFKYRIKELKKLTGIQHQFIVGKTGIDRQSLYLYMNIEIDSKSSIPSDKLRLIADVYGLSMEEMYTTPILQPA